jgi:hypothetical protein
VVNDLTIASLDGFACFERDEDLEDRGGLEMENEEQTEVQRLEEVAERAKQNMMRGSQLPPSFDMAADAYNDALQRLSDARKKEEEGEGA